MFAARGNVVDGSVYGEEDGEVGVRAGVAEEVGVCVLGWSILPTHININRYP